MGDISTHRQIEERIMSRITRLRGAHGEEPLHMELGNWLTDVSQFRDPPAHIAAKLTVWKTAKKEKALARIPLLLDLIADLDGYLIGLLGEPGQPSRLGEWFRDIIFIVGLEKFRPHRSMSGSASVPADSFIRIYERYFTQYWPHEHVDFPNAKAKNIGGWGTYEDSGRRTPKYLEEQSIAIGELLTRIEVEWARIDPAAGNLEARHDLLARWGHASHAVEDFFFHSNYVEQAWRAKRGGASASWPVKERRVYFRLLRQPEPDDDGAPKSATIVSPIVFTAALGANELYHTLMDGAGPIFANIDQMLLRGNLAQATVGSLHAGASEAWTRWRARAERFRRLAPPEDTYRGTAEQVERKVADFTKIQEKDLAEHLRDLDPKSGHWASDGELLGRLGIWHAESVAAWKRAGQRDWELAGAFKRVPTRGILGFLQQLGGIAAQKHFEAEAASDRLDARNLVEDPRGQNESTMETVGTHTLLGKDSDRKPPLRAETIQIATRVTQYIAEVMLRQVDADQASVARSHTGGGDPARESTLDRVPYVDWIELLRYFLGHPDNALGPPGGRAWWEIALEDPLDGKTGHRVVPITKEEAERRAKEPKRAELEKLYTALERFYETRFVSEVRTEFLLDVLLLGAVLAAGIVVGVVTGKPLAGVLAGAGALLGMVGGAMLGGMTGDDPTAGSFLGGLLGAAAGAAAGSALSRLF